MRCSEAGDELADDEPRRRPRAARRIARRRRCPAACCGSTSRPATRGRGASGRHAGGDEDADRVEAPGAGRRARGARRGRRRRPRRPGADGAWRTREGGPIASRSSRSVRATACRTKPASSPPRRRWRSSKGSPAPDCRSSRSTSFVSPTRRAAARRRRRGVPARAAPRRRALPGARAEHARAASAPRPPARTRSPCSRRRREAFTEANIGMTIAESLAAFSPVLERGGASSAGGGAATSRPRSAVPTRARSSPRRSWRSRRRCSTWAATRSRSATRSASPTPDDVAASCDALLERMPVERLALHLHDTSGRALENVRPDSSSASPPSMRRRAARAAARSHRALPATSRPRRCAPARRLGIEHGVDAGKVAAAAIALRAQMVSETAPEVSTDTVEVTRRAARRLRSRPSRPGRSGRRR